MASREGVLLVVDDDAHMCDWIREICTRALPKVRIVPALSGGEALRLAASEKPGVVVLDVRMPDIDGFEVCRRLKADPDLEGIHILMISGAFTDMNDRLRGIETGADGYLCKPFRMEELAVQVKALFRWWESEATKREHLEQLVAERTAALCEANELLRLEIAERRRAEETLARMPREIIAAQEAERRRVARDLHDGIGQILFSARLRLQALGKDVPARPGERRAINALLDRAIREVRDLSRHLRPSELDDLGLVAAVRSVCAEFAERTGVAVEARLPEEGDRLPGDLEVTLYRLIQESLCNVGKHAGATRVAVGLARDEHGVVLTVEDDGRGFARPAKPGAADRARGGMGIANMRERVALHQGTFSIASRLPKGVEIEARIPLPGAPATGAPGA